MTELDFIPPAYHQQVSRRRTIHAQGLWAVALGVAMVVWFWSNHVQVARAEEHLAERQREWTSISDRQRCFDELAAERARLEVRESAVNALDDEASLSIVLAELGILLPDGAVLTGFTLDTAATDGLDAAPAVARQPQPSPTSPARPAHSSVTTLKLIGAAPTNVHISAFTARLSGSPVFFDVSTGIIRDAAIGDRQVRHFEVECAVTLQEGGPK